jgi:hypothetical protein
MNSKEKNCFNKLPFHIIKDEIDRQDFLNLLINGAPEDEYDIESKEIYWSIIKYFKKRKRNKMKIYLTEFQSKKILFDTFVDYFARDTDGVICRLMYSNLERRLTDFNMSSSIICREVNLFVM